MITLNWICIYLNISLYAPSGKRNVCTCDDCQGRTGHARAGKRSSRQGCLPDCCTKGLLRSFICKWKPNAHADKQDERTSDDTHTHTHAQRAEETVKDNLAATVWQTHTQPPRPYILLSQAEAAAAARQCLAKGLWRPPLYSWLESRWKCREG